MLSLTDKRVLSCKRIWGVPIVPAMMPHTRVSCLRAFRLVLPLVSVPTVDTRHGPAAQRPITSTACAHHETPRRRDAPA
jgi:hypothetical protein